MANLSSIRRIVCILLGIPCLGLGCRIGYSICTHGFSGSTEIAAALVLGIACLALGCGLIAHHFWARRMAALICLLVAFSSPFIYIKPFEAMDTQSTNIGGFLIWMVPLVIALLLLAWLVDPPSVQSSGKSSAT